METKINVIPERIKNRISILPSPGCWNWTACKTNRGYGKTSLNGMTTYVHRAIWVINFGEIPTGMYVCHKCDNPSCCNPEHLFLGTQKDNMRDCANKDRINRTNGNTNKKFCKHGHEFTDENTHINKKGHRQCRKCDKEWHNKYYDPETQTSHK
jgi:hypothetical protein